MMRHGILVSGNWIIDNVKVIDSYPDEEKLVNIISEYRSNGGSAFNMLKDLAKLNVRFPLSAVGLVGDDKLGNSIIEECKTMAIDVAQLRKTPSALTSYTDVMTVESTGRRTFFHQRGANDLLDIEHFNLQSSNAKIFHLGYLLLLKQLDKMESDGTTRAAKILKEAKEKGFITSADVVSERSSRFTELIPATLPYIDFLFVNEYEAEMITGVQTSINGEVLTNQCIAAASTMLEMGVNSWVLVHFPQGVIAVSKEGKQLFQPSVNLPSNKIIGAVGAGDAFAAGVLMGVHENWEMDKCLELGVCAAASSLTAATSSDGILPAHQCLTLSKSYGFKAVFETDLKEIANN